MQWNDRRTPPGQLSDVRPSTLTGISRPGDTSKPKALGKNNWPKPDTTAKPSRPTRTPAPSARSRASWGTPSPAVTRGKLGR